MYKLVHEFLDYHAVVHPDIEFLVDGDAAYSYREAGDWVDRIAAGLGGMSLSPGSRVALLGKNSAQQFLTYLACAKSGLVPVGLNYRLAPEEWSFIAEDAEAEHLFADEEFLLDAQGYAKNLPVHTLVGTVDGVQSVMDWAQSANASAPFVAPTLEDEDVLIQMYTSGTTGHPKGALLSHRNVIHNVLQGVMTNGDVPHFGDRFLLIAPAYHAAGLVSAFMCLMFGATIVIHRDYDPVAMIETLANDNISGVTVVPVMLQFSLACVPNIKDYNFTSLQRITYGASPISEDLLRQCMEIFQCDFTQGYGQTETTATVAMLTKEDHERALRGEPHLLRSCGKAMAGTEIKIVDDQGRELPAGETGEIVARGGQVMKGYWKRDAATAQTIQGGWIHTGDAGMLDEEGYLYIQDRIKDMIISGGENIYPAELENVLMSHPAIQDVAVIGVPDAVWGEVPMAVVVAAPGTRLDINELSAHCRQHLAAYKIPKHLQFTDMLPRNPSGKILKKDLRKVYADKFQQQAESSVEA